MTDKGDGKTGQMILLEGVAETQSQFRVKEQVQIGVTG